MAESESESESESDETSPLNRGTQYKRKQETTFKKLCCLRVSQDDQATGKVITVKKNSWWPFGWFGTTQGDHSQGEDQTSERATETEADSQLDTWERLTFGEVLQQEGTKLRYTFYNPQFHFPKSPVLGWYSSRQCLYLQTHFAGKMLSSNALDISTVELHAGVTFRAAQREVPQTGSKQVFVSGTGWPVLTGGNVMTTPEIQDSNILLLLQQSMMILLCDCLIITVKEINRYQLQSLLKILVLAKENSTTVIIFHHVENEEAFKAQYMLIEDCLPILEVSHSTAVEGDRSPEYLLQDCSISSRKMKLFHFQSSGMQEETFSNVQRYIEIFGSMSGRHHHNTMQELFLQTINNFAHLTNLKKLIRVHKTQETVNGSHQLTVTVSLEA